MTRKILPIMLLSAVSQTAIANSGCDTSNTVSGWGAWCGIETYLSQQEPTAAGPANGLNPRGFTRTTFDSDQFGGAIEENSYNWSGYALFYDLDQQAAVLAKLEMNVDEANNALLGVKATLNNGEVITVSTEGFYQQIITGGQGVVANLTTNLNQENQSRYVFAGLTNTLLSSASYNEDGSYVGLAAIADLKPGQFQGLESLQSIGIGVAGSPTPVVDMANLKSIQAYAPYSVLGVASISGDINDVGGFMTKLGVDFGNGSWDMENVRFQGLQNGSIRVPISASGSITGNSFTSESISLMGNENYIQTGSYINGKFLGPQAKAITGEADITTVSLPTPARVAPSIPAMNIKATFAGQKDHQFDSTVDY